jgi:hypothetical protein
VSAQQASRVNFALQCVSRRSQGKPQQVRELLAPVYGWFTEGFDTRDLKEMTLFNEPHGH